MVLIFIGICGMPMNAVYIPGPGGLFNRQPVGLCPAANPTIASTVQWSRARRLGAYIYSWRAYFAKYLEMDSRCLLSSCTCSFLVSYHSRTCRFLVFSYYKHNTMSYNRVSGDAQTAHCPTSSDTTHTGALSRYLASRILTVS